MASCRSKKSVFGAGNSTDWTRIFPTPRRATDLAGRAALQPGTSFGRGAAQRRKSVIASPAFKRRRKINPRALEPRFR